MKLKKITIALFAALAVPATSYAVTLGEVRVNSYLSQPLEAEIDLVGLTPGQHEDLRLRIANEQYFERMGITHDPLLHDLQFDVVRSGGQWLARVRSKRPVREPFLEFPLHLSWPGGHLIRQYTLLFDPPRRVQPARAASVRRPVPAADQSSPDMTGKVSVDTYGPVRKGETLWPIAKQLKPRGITTRQMMMALLRANPEAFVDGNINNLRAGATLKIPLRAFIEELDAETARVEFAEHNRRWEPPSIGTSPRALERVTDLSADESTPSPTQPTDSAEAAEATKAADEMAKPPPPQDQLRIVNEQADATAQPEKTAQDLQDKLLVTLEQIESNRLTTDAMEARLARLEAELERMQQLIELKNTQIAALRSEVAADKTARQAAPPTDAASAQPAPVPGATPVEAGQAPVTATPAEVAPGPISIAAHVPQNLPGDAAGAPWYREHLWLLWPALGVLGLTALGLIWRRQPQSAEREHTRLADLPEIRDAKPAPYSAAAMGESAALQEAEEHFRRLERERLGDEAETDDALASLPELDIPGAATPDDAGKRLRKPAQQHVPGADASDEDIASWVQELSRGDDDEPLKLDEDDVPEILHELDDRLGASDAPMWADDPGPETLEGPEEETLILDADVPDIVTDLEEPIAATEPHMALDLSEIEDELATGLEDELPSILTELDDQLDTPEVHVQPPGAASAADEDEYEDDAFSMSLDLARAYIEIGDEEGAKDMLQQALSGARAPDHRRQIEELLQKIG